jgi:uncharacterized membrane protein
MTGIVAVHIAGGSLAIVSGYSAVFAPKGKWLHRKAGIVFVIAMLVMGLGALLVGLEREKVSWLGGPLVAYLVITALLTVRRPASVVPLRDGALMVFAAVMGSMFISQGFQAVANGGALQGVYAPAFFLNGVVALLGAAGDARLLRSGPLTGNRRLARHLWRMCFAMFMATGSFFLGQAKVLPPALRVWPVLITLAVLPLVLLGYWMWRTRRKATPVPSAS